MSDERPGRELREWIAHGYTLAEDIVYLGLGLLLACTVIALLIATFISFGRSVAAWSLSTGIVDLLDQILLILLIVELLYTVQLSFRAHALVPEPFLLVGIISAIRRVLVLTAELGQWHAKKESVPHSVILELGVLSILIVALALSLVLLRRKDSDVIAKRT